MVWGRGSILQAQDQASILYWAWLWPGTFTVLPVSPSLSEVEYYQSAAGVWYFPFWSQLGSGNTPSRLGSVWLVWLDLLKRTVFWHVSKWLLFPARASWGYFSLVITVGNLVKTPGRKSHKTVGTSLWLNPPGVLTLRLVHIEFPPSALAPVAIWVFALINH